ncbi:MAG: nuclear transport factor 2 family protein [bacterium]
MRHQLRDILFGTLFVVCLLIGCSLGGGHSAAAPAAPTGDEAALNTLIDKFQTSYSTKDYAALRTCFHPKANVAIDYLGGTVQSSSLINDWIKDTENILKDKSQVSDVLSNREFTVYRNIATVVADYDYRSGLDHQVGQDVFTCIKFNGEWKIFCLVFYGDPAK